MKNTILQKLYEGKIYPSESIIVSNAEYDELNSELTETKKCFLKNLSAGDCETFEKMEDLEHGLDAIYGYENFVHGFKLAVNLIFEALEGADTLTRNDEK